MGSSREGGGGGASFPFPAKHKGLTFFPNKALTFSGRSHKCHLAGYFELPKAKSAFSISPFVFEQMLHKYTYFPFKLKPRRNLLFRLCLELHQTFSD